MTIDAKSMQAFAKQGEHAEGPPPNKGEGAHDEPDNEEGEGAEKKFEKLLDLLEQHGPDIEACLEELDPEQLTNFAEELGEADKHILREGFDDLDQALTDEARHVLPGINEEEAEKLGEHLEAEGSVDDGHNVGAWLFRVGEMLDESPPSSEGGDEEKDEEDEDEDEGPDSEPPPSSKG